MSTRSRTSSSTTVASKSDLPPARQGKATKRVKPPLHSTRLNRLIYVLVLLTTLLTAYYSYRFVQWKTEVGGWWNLALGKKPPAYDTASERRSGRGRGDGYGDSVEDRINALAEALGMPSGDLAKAVASAVREYVPPASLSSIKEKETGKPAVEELLRGNGEGKKVETGGGDPGTTGVVEGVVNGMGSFVGFDEP